MATTTATTTGLTTTVTNSKNVDNNVNTDSVESVDPVISNPSEEETIESLTQALENFGPENRAKGRPKADLSLKYMDVIAKSIQNLGTEISKMRNENTKALNMMKGVNERVQKLEVENGTLNTKLNELEKKVEDLERKEDDRDQKELSNKVIVRCKIPSQREAPTLSEDGNAISALGGNQTPSLDDVMTHLCDELHLGTDDRQLLSIRKLGMIENTYVIEIKNQSLKSKLFKNCKEYAPQDFFLNEYLTKKRHRLMFELRELKRDTSTNGTIQRVYSFNGKVIIKKSGQVNPLQINTLSDWQA